MGSPAAVFASDRRRHSRFSIATAERSRLVVMGATAEREECALLDVSFGGVCFRASRRLEPGAIRQFRIELASPIGFSVLVQAQVRWVRPSRSEGYEVGAEFLESSKGWLGPEED